MTSLCGERGNVARDVDDEALVAIARSRAEAIEASTARLVRIDSQTPPSATRPVAEAAAAMLADTPGVTIDLHEGEPPVTNLVARLAGGRPGPRLILNGHLDTYPIGDRDAWSHDPLGGEVADGRLYGRGSADMKGGIAALIETVRLFAERMQPFPGEIVLTLAGDEERMGERGTQWLIDHVPEVSGDGVIVADAGGPAAVRLGEKGMIWVDLVATGRQAHGAHVHAGTNAVERLVDALIDLRGVEEMPVSAPEDAARVVEYAATIPNSDTPAARETMKRVTVNVGTVAGGISSNLVPPRASAGLDIRIPLGLSVRDVEDSIVERLETRPGLSWQVTRRYEPSWTSISAPIARACIAAAKQVLDGAAWADMRIGASDARLWRRAGMETVVLGLTPYNLGAPDENLETGELCQLLAIYSLAARKFLDGGRTGE